MELIEHPIKDFTLCYEPQASELIYHLTAGHPFLAQLLCSEVVSLKNEQEPSIRRLARVADVEEAVPEAISHGSLFFADIERNQLDSQGLELLCYMASKGKEYITTTSELAAQLGEDTEPTLAAVLRRDLIEPANDGYRFKIELIRRWFSKVRRQTVVRPELNIEAM